MQAMQAPQAAVSWTNQACTVRVAPLPGPGASYSAEVVDHRVLELRGVDGQLLLRVDLQEAVHTDSAAITFSKRHQALTFTAQRKQQAAGGEADDADLLAEMLGAELFALGGQQQAQRGHASEAAACPHAEEACAPAACTSGNGPVPAAQPQQQPQQPQQQQQQQQQPQQQQQQQQSHHPPPHSQPGPPCTAQPEVPAAQGIDCSGLATTLHPITISKAKSSKKAAKEEKRAVTAMLDTIAHSLATKGWAVCDNYVPMDQVIEVRKEVKIMEEHYIEGEIWVGKDADSGATIARKDVRGDVVLWLDQAALTATAYEKDGQRHKCSFSTLSRVMQSIDSLVTEQLPARSPLLANVRERSDVMMAIYPGGGSRFAKHIDNTANDGRRLTLLCYLNPNWKEHNGGALRLTPPSGPVVDVYPHAGRLAMFMSKTVAHEVMPTRVPRHSFTLWYYDALERAEAVAAAQVAGRGAASAAEQQEARDLIRDILSGGGSEGAMQVNEEGVSALRARVRNTSMAAMSIVASVTGAPSTQDLLDAVERMVPSELANLRESLANMGLEAKHAHAPSPV